MRKDESGGIYYAIRDESSKIADGLSLKIFGPGEATVLFVFYSINE